MSVLAQLFLKLVVPFFLFFFFFFYVLFLATIYLIYGMQQPLNYYRLPKRRPLILIHNFENGMKIVVAGNEPFTVLQQIF